MARAANNCSSLLAHSKEKHSKIDKITKHATQTLTNHFSQNQSDPKLKPSQNQNLLANPGGEASYEEELLRVSSILTTKTKPQVSSDEALSNSEEEEPIEDEEDEEELEAVACSADSEDKTIGASTNQRVWQDVPILVIVSMLAYFCFLEQLLVGKMGSGAIALSLPFSCILGLLASMTATTMVKRKYVWVYATIQFALVVLSAHLLYSLIHMQAVLSVLLATFTGFGVTMCGNSIIIEALEWRERWLSRSNQQHGTPAVTQPNQPQQTQTNPRQLENEIQGAEAIHGS